MEAVVKNREGECLIIADVSSQYAQLHVPLVLIPLRTRSEDKRCRVNDTQLKAEGC